MATWSQLQEQAPGLAAAVAARFAAHKHKTMATVRRDGAPRICGTEVEMVDGQVYLGGMTDNRRFADLRRDPRVAIHSGSDEPDTWSGDAKVSGLAVEVLDDAEIDRFRAAVEQVPPGPFELFRVDLTQAVVVRLDDAREHLLIETWKDGEPVTTVVRR